LLALPEILELLGRLDPIIGELTKAAEQEARKRPEVVRLMTHPGVGSLPALAYVLIIGTPERFHCGKQIGTYVEACTLAQLTDRIAEVLL
jgi:transposase